MTNREDNEIMGDSEPTLKIGPGVDFLMSLYEDAITGECGKDGTHGPHQRVGDPDVMCPGTPNFVRVMCDNEWLTQLG